MATIEKRADKTGGYTYRVKVRLQGYRQENATFKRITDAKRWAAQTESAIREGRYFKTPASKSRTLMDAIEKYRQECLPDLKLKDQKHREHHLNWWSSELGFKYLADILPQTISECRAKLKNTTSTYGKHNGNKRTEATVNRYIASLSPVFKAAVVEWNWLESNPCEKVPRGKEGGGRTRFLSHDERRSLLAACNANTKLPELTVIILIAITTGARKGEILGLRWRTVDLQRKRLLFEDTKNGDTRSVPLVGPAFDAMKVWAQVRPIDDNALVFHGRGENTKNKPLDFERTWQETRIKAGLENFRFHDLRHTAASYLAMHGAGLREIGDILGHKTLAMVQRYSHLCEDHKKTTVERMTNAIFGG